MVQSHFGIQPFLCFAFLLSWPLPQDAGEGKAEGEVEGEWKWEGAEIMRHLAVGGRSRDGMGAQ